MELPPPGNRRVSISNPQETPHRLSTAHGVMPARSSMASSIGSPKPHALPDAHKSSIPSSVPGGSMLPSSIPQKSALFLPDATAHQRRGSTVSSVRYADEQAKQVASDKEKDKEKKGKSKGKSKNKGAGLLNMLRKTLQGSQSEEMVVTSETPNLVPFGDVVGCLAVHIKSCRQFSHRFIVQQHVNLFIRICINHVTKCTKLRNLKATNNEKNLVLRFDEVKYFSVQVPRRQDDERNNIFLELMQDGGSTERPALSLGGVEAHLYEIIQKGCFTEVLQMKHRNSSICRVEVEFMFSYGTFGYGFSHQLKPLQKIIEPSMFMKIAPPPERTDPVTNVITPQRVEYPAFLSPELNVSVGAAESSHPNAVRLEKLQEKPRERLEKMKEEYKNLNTWMEKSEYLRNLITPKVASKVSEEPSLNDLSEFVDKGDKEGRGIPVVKLVDQDFSEHTLAESVESTPGDIPLPPIHTLQIIEEDETPRSSTQAAPEWDVPYEERKSVVFPPDHSLIPKRPSILRIASSLQEVKSSLPVNPESPTQIRQTWERHPTDLTSSLRKVAFVQKEYTTPVFRADSREFKPKYQFQKLIKSGLDPFLRNINSKMPFRKKKGQGAHKSPSISSADDAEHEDQDPPYTEHSRSAGSHTSWAEDPNLATTHMLPNVPFPNYQKESSSPENVNIYHPLSSTKLTSDAENRRPSTALKSVFRRNLQDLSDELFPKPDAGTNTAEAVRGSSSLSLSVRDRPSNGVEDKVFEKVQDIKNWLSSKDILNSQALLSPVVKSVPQDVLPEGGPGTSSDIGGVSGKPLEAAEINFPTNRKSSFKAKHLVSEASSSSLGLNGGVYEHIIKQIFTGPLLSHLEAGMALSEAQTALQKQLLASSERSSSSQIDNYDSNEVPLSPAKSSISRILQSFPVDTLLESGMISVTELEKENQSSLLDGQTASPEDKVQNPTEQHSNVQSQIKLLSRRTTPTTQPTDTFVSGADYQEDSQRIDKQSDFLNEQQHLDTEETGLSSTLETLSSSFVGKLKDIDAVMLKSFLKNIFRAFFKYNQSEKELDRLISHSAPHGAEHLEKIQGDFNKADRVDRKATLDPKLCGLLEKLSESEVKTLKVELGKHIQHYLIERLSEVGHITKEDLPKVYGNLGQMSEKAEAKEPSPPQDKDSETIKEVVSFVKSFNHHFVDKHLETKLRSFLNEILQKCCLRNLSGSNLFNEADSMSLRPSMSSLRSKSTPRCLPELEQDIASGGLDSKLKINMKYPLSESLQNCLNVLPENELLGLKTDLNKYVQVLFIEKLQKSGLITEKQLEGISQQVNSLDSSSRSLNYTKPDLSLRDESYFMREDSEKQKKYPKVCQNPMSPTFLEDPYGEKELTQEEESGGSFSHSLKENPPAVWEHKHVYSREVKTLIKVQPHPNKNIQANPLNKSPERLADLLLKKHQKDHGFMQLPQAENSVYKAETQESYSWDGRSKSVQSKLCFEKTLRAKSLDKRESNNICKLLAQEKPDTGLPPYLKLPTSKMSRENEHLNRLPFPTWRNNTFLYVNTESGEQSKLDKYCQKWKGNNNNNKKHLVTFAQFKNEMETLYTNPYEACREKCTKISELPPFENKEDGRDSRPSFFPEVLKRENMKSKRRDYIVKPKKSFYKLVRILPATLPTRPHLRKSVPRTLLHWTARRTIHDCLDRFDDLHMPSVKRPKNSKSRARLLGKSPDDPHNQAKHCARPFTAPNKGRESVAGKFASPRMVSAGLVHIHDTTPEYEIRKIRSKRKLKENIEKRPLICDIIQMLDTIG
ncbi:C2 calcium-dependent domain-containing protein 6 [Microtus ochrogaster]|uniref:C2 calcium-dependent domain-containing protein 6 n=1 Tax=Microtus ochrogaster TaxID=79684 RepID=A0ABM1URM1_MICOH|nr:C2 calcium-dependent domain-containing protein 6 [Microtus ochrogaster]